MEPSKSLGRLLTRREEEILSLLAANRSNPEIAAGLHLSLNSVKWYTRQIYTKLGVADRRAAVVKARELGMLAESGPASDHSHLPAQPTGTVTFLFTDIEGSTPLWEQMPNEMKASVARHHAILRKAIESNGGHVTQIIGDEFQSAFWLASQALNAALDAQRELQSTEWGKTGPVRVRIGLHTGSAEPDPKGDAPYAVSHTLNRAGRVRSAAAGGQILLSQETKDLVERSLPEGVTLRDLGEHHLKGMQWAEHLYQVVAPDLPSDFPPMAASIAHPNNLPPELTSFIGREVEVTHLEELERDGAHRLVTLTRAGGTGKTRLAQRVCRQVLDAFRDGVWLVELAPVGEPGLVANALARALGLQEVKGVPMLETLCGYMEKRCMLVMLDNCEHLLSECARVVDTLLRSCPKLHILATSRELLNVPGETVFHVPSLHLADPDHLQSIEELSKVEAVQLFAERAMQATSGFQLEVNNAHEVAVICQRLDGIPLAIELAAARVRVMPVQQIAARLSNVFRLLTGGARTVMPRQQTLKATIDWSYALLEEQEKLALQRLSVFDGSWTLEAAETVCAGEGIAPEEILDLQAALVDKSFASLTSSEAGLGRYRMLETIRQYARDRLLESGRGEAARDRHLAYYLKLGKQAEPHLFGAGEQVAWINRIEEELGNLRLALEWALSSGTIQHISDGMRLIYSSCFFWYIRHGQEGIKWVQQLIKTEGEVRGNIHLEVGVQSNDEILAWCKAIVASSALFLISPSNLVQQAGILSSSERLCRQMGETAGEVLTWILFYRALYTFENPEQGYHFIQECIDLARSLQHPNAGSFLEKEFYTSRLFTELFQKGEIEQASFYMEKDLAIAQTYGDVDWTAATLDMLGRLCYYRGEYLRGKVLFNESIEKYHELGSRRFYYYVATVRLLFHLAEEERNPEIYRQAEEALLYFQETREWDYLYDALYKFIIVEWDLGYYERAREYGKKRVELSNTYDLEYGLPPMELWLGRVELTQGDLNNSRHYIFPAAKKISEDLSAWFVDDNGPFRPHEILLIWAVDALAIYYVSMGDKLQSAKLFGAEEKMYTYFHLGFPVRLRREHDEALATVRHGMELEAFQAAWREGQTLTLEQAIQSALKA